MSNRKQPMAHPAEEELLRLSDGELSSRQAAGTRNHLELCWHCRSRLDELEAGIADYMRYEQNVLTPLLPSPPRPWTDLGRRMEEHDATAAIRRSPRMRWIPPTWLAVAAAALLAVLLVWRFERVPAVSATELLRKAATSESSRPVAQRRIRIRTRHRNYTRSASLRSANSDASPELQKLFEEARFSWDNPLSVEAYRAWHDQLPEKQDDVKSTAIDYVIHTSTTANVLTSATLTLRAQDLQAVSERLEFQPGEWVEISEAPEEPAASPATTPKAYKEESPVVAERAAAGPAEELQVTVALHRISADLGEPIEMTRDGSKLVVAAMGLGPRRQSQVRAAVAKIPGVEVRFDQPELMSSQPGIPVAPRRDASGALSALQIQIQNQIGDPGSVEEFTNRVLDASEAAMARAYALRALARRFAPEIEARLSPEDRNILAGLRQDHLSSLRVRVRQIDRLLEPALADLAPSRETQSASAASPEWQMQAQQVFASMQRVDQLLSAMLAGDDSGSAGQSPGDLASALGLLEAQLARSR
ncbi:MAG: hypothetical protein ACR2NN_02180 [Bryobacteraceae bacterium]